MSWTPPPREPWVERLNALGRNLGDDGRSLVPLDEATVLASVRRTHRAVVVDEGWRSGSLAAEVTARIAEQAFYDLDAPVVRVCTAEVPLPYAHQLEDAALPRTERVVAAVRHTLGGV